MRASIRIILFAIYLFTTFQIAAQPPKSYQKFIKKKEKEQKGSDDLLQNQENSAKELKKFDDKLTALDKKKKDAEASGDQVEIDKIDQKIRSVKGEKSFVQNKIEAKMVKKYHKMQDKEVRKRMKKSKKKSSRINSNKREPFFTRMFRK
ncbi:MAG TPA: hypothetical protein EYN89_00080 [Flavobacteriales bacterium]|nr:hypothetical protein [Flavobacteriales bacterium]